MSTGNVPSVKTGAAALMLLAVSACDLSPDLSKVEASFVAGTAGAGATKVGSALSQSAFGQQITHAVNTSPDLARSSVRIRAAEAAEEAAKGAFRPQLSVGANVRSSQRVSTNTANASPYVRLSQLVYDGGAAQGDETAARARVLESRGKQISTAAAVTLEAIEVYVMVLNRRQLLAIAHNNVKTHEMLENQISTRADSGIGSNADILAARSRVADARTGYADAQALADRAEARFREIFGTSANSLPTPQPAPGLERSNSEIVLDSPQIRSLTASLKAAEADLAAAKARRRPSLVAGALGNQDQSRNADVSVDLSLSFDLDTTGQRRAAVKAAEAELEDVRFERDLRIREIGRELEFIRSDQKTGAERLRAARVAAKANADSVAAAREQFTIGRRSLIEILDAQRDYVSAQGRLILAEQDFFLTNYAALSLTGDILDVFGIALTDWGSTDDAPS